MHRIKPVTRQHARALRREMTDAEKLLWGHLRGKQLGGFKFRRQHPLGQYILDFVCLEAGVVVEVDGGQHGRQQAYDRLRTAWLERQGFRVLRLWNHEVLNDLDSAKEAIWLALHSSAKPPS